MKITKRVNFRVVVWPYVDDIGAAWVEHYTKSICEFCGHDWSDYPDCCGEAQAEAAQHLVEAPND